MKMCPFSAEGIQDAAIVCKHCGRDIPVTASTPPIALLANVPARPSAVQRLARSMVQAVFAFGAVTTLIALTRADMRSPEGNAPKKPLDVHVTWNSAAVEIANKSTPAGGEMTVYINGTPPFTYRADSRVPAVGEAVRIPLREFVTQRGDRFDPMSTAVTVVWVGGDGFDFESYPKR